MVYAQQHARMAAQENEIVVVEGYMDAIACHQAGFKGAVAPLGTALTEEQMMVLWKMIPHERKEPVLCFDGDNAGYRAAVRAVERIMPLLKPNQSVRFAFLPKGDDPDTFIQENGRDAFAQLIGKAISALDFIWAHNTAGQKFDTPETRAGLSAKLDELAAHIPDAQLQYLYKQAFRDKTRALFSTYTKPAFTKGQGSGNFTGKNPPPPKVALPPLSKKRSSDLIPQILLLGVVNHPRIYGWVQESFHQLDPGSAELRGLSDSLVEVLEGPEAESLDRKALLSHINSLGLADIVDRLANERLYIHAGFARPDADPDKVLEGWKSLFNQWDNSRLLEDIEAAKAVLRSSMTPEDESRMIALQHLRNEKGTGTD
jgi:DNA primase